MDFITINDYNHNVYELIDYYKNIYKYYIKEKNNIYNILSGLDNEVVIQDDNNKYNNDFSNFYFFYIQKISNKKNNNRRSGFKLKKINNIIINKSNDFLVGIKMNNCDINSNISIYSYTKKYKILINNFKLDENNKNNIFLPIYNRDFYPFFLSNNSNKIIIESNNNINSVDLIYLKLHPSYSNKFLNYGSVVYKIKDNNYIEFKDYFTHIHNINYTIFPNDFIYICDIEKYYGIKILKYLKKCVLKKHLKKILYDKYDYYQDVTNLLCKFI